MKSSISKWLVFTLVATAPLFAGAQVLGTVKGDITAVDSVEQYRLDPATKVYNATLISTRTVGSIIGDGKLSGMTSNVNEKQSIVPGVNLKGYQRITLAPKNGKLYLEEEGAINDKMSGIQINYKTSLEIETEFVVGSLQDLAQGQRVIVKPTEAGKKAILAEAVKSFAVMTGQAFQNTPLDGFKFDPQITQSEISDNIRYEISKDEISVSNPSLRWIATFTVKK